uniref:Receptor expression-enhancing protein n=1 Tax=Anopheles atroparvus TaxID=41427 RepID=A0AAG5DNV3_ANOAO
MISAIVSRLVILLFGTLYPAYASYKAVRTKNVKEYVKWMMYWIVFAFFTCIETFTDILLSWFPFYYEIKVIIVLWLLSPATRGSSTLYRKFVHPMLTRREQEIDDYINQAKEKGYTAVLQLGSKGVNYATNVIMQTAIKGGGGLVQTLRKSYSLSDLSEPDTQRTQDEVDEIANRPQRVLRSKSSRSSSGSRQMEMYFPEVEIAGTPYHHQVAAAAPPYNYIRSSDDISSGYSSAAEPGLSRTASMSNTARPRLKSKTREDDNYEGDIFYDDQGPGASAFYPQRATIYELPHSPAPLPAITQPGHSAGTAAFSGPIYSSGTQRSGSLSGTGSVPAGDMNDKYSLFLAWLEEQKKRESVKNDKTEESTVGGNTYGKEHAADENSFLDSENKAETPIVEKEIKDHVETDRRFVDSLTAALPDEDRKVVDDINREQQNALEDKVNLEANVTNGGEWPNVDEDFRDTISVSSNENDEFLEVDTIEPMDSGELPPVDELDQPMMDDIEVEKKEPEDAIEGKVSEDIVEVEKKDKVEPCVALEVEGEASPEQDSKVLELKTHPVEEHDAVTVTKPTEENTPPEVGPQQLLQAVSSSSLTASTSSLATSESSENSVINLGAIDAQAKKHASFGKQRKAPPVPSSTAASPEMVVIREPRVTKSPTALAPPTAAPRVSSPSSNRGLSVERKQPVAAAAPKASNSASSPKPKKFMSSLTGMFKTHGHETAPTGRPRNASPSPAPGGGHPKETEI